MSGNGVAFPPDRAEVPANAAHPGYMPRWHVGDATHAPFGAVQVGSHSDVYGKPATASMAGAMSGADKALLDNLVSLQTTFPSARVYHNANQSIANSTTTALAFNSERVDTHGFHDTVTNNGLLSVPASFGGLYLIGFTGQFAASAAGTRRIVIIDHSTAGNIAWAEILPSAALPSLVLATLYPLTAGQWVRVLVHQDSGGALNVTSGAQYSPEFWLTRLGG